VRDVASVEQKIGCRSSDVHGGISIFSDFRSLVLLVMDLFGMLFKEYDFMIKVKSIKLTHSRSRCTNSLSDVNQLIDNY